MAQFGYTTIGTFFAQITDTIRGSFFTAPASGSVTLITANINNSAGTTQTMATKCAIYRKSDNALIAASTEDSRSYTTGQSILVDYTISAVITSGVDYYLVVNSSNANARSTRDTVSGGASQSISYGTYPDPFVPVTNSFRHTIYATYTAYPSPSVADSSAVSDTITIFPLLAAPSTSESTVVSDNPTIVLLVPFAINVIEQSVVTDSKTVTLPSVPTNLFVVLDGVSNSNGMVAGIKIVS